MTIDQVGDDVVCIVQAIVKNKKLTDEDKQALTGTRTLRYKIAELDPEKVANDLLDWENVVLDGEQQLEDIEETIKKRVATKKSKSTPAKTQHKTKPKKKTQAELRDEMREKQAKDKQGQASLFDAEEDRLSDKPKDDNPKELKTATEKAMEKADEGPSLDDL
jgi:hypothetical protein